MQHRTAEQLQTLMTSIAKTEGYSDGEGTAAPTSDRLLEQLSALGDLERLAKVALRECVVELRRERVTWERIGETFGSSLESAYGRWHDAEVHDKADMLAKDFADLNQPASVSDAQDD